MVLPAGLFLMFAGSCLIATDPPFSDPEQTRPFLVPDSVFPDPRETIIINETSALTFRAKVQSEDAGEPVQAALLLNYGRASPFGPFDRPYKDIFGPFPFASASTWSAGPRDGTPIDWNFVDDILKMDEPGCYRFTLMVGHHFDTQGCPASEDYDAVSWQVVLCGVDGCPTELDCPEVEFSCTQLPPLDAP